MKISLRITDSTIQIEYTSMNTSLNNATSSLKKRISSAKAHRSWRNY